MLCFANRFLCIVVENVYSTVKYKNVVSMDYFECGTNLRIVIGQLKG